MQIKIGISTCYFHQFWMCKKYHKTVKHISRNYGNFSWDFHKNLTCTGVQIAKTWVPLASKFKKLKKHMKNLCYPAQTHGSDGSGSPKCFRSVGLIRIQQDLDQTAESKREWTGFGSTRFTCLYKRVYNPVSFIFLERFSFFLSSSPSFSLHKP